MEFSAGRARIALVAAAVLAVSACGDDDDPETETVAAPPPAASQPPPEPSEPPADPSEPPPEPDEPPADPGEPPDQNSPPTISGTPPSSVMVDEAYRFSPSADDVDGDTLSFSIENPPVWASFDTATGQLSGTPGAADVGSYAAISITVTDGEASASLGPFAIQVLATASGTATLTWMPPTENTDGSPLLDLAGYRIYWGTARGSYDKSVTLDNPGITTYIVENLGPGTYYFVTTAFNGNGIESTYSNAASKTIP